MSGENSQIMLIDAPQAPAKAKFSLKQELFIKFYMENFNGADAARRAGYSERTARYMAYENLEKPHIAREIKRRLELLGLTAEEVLSRLGKMARGEQPTKTVNKDGEVTLIYDERMALENIARAHGMFVDRHQIQAMPGLDIVDADE